MINKQMECWILFDGDIEGTDPGAYEARRLIEAGRRKEIIVRVLRPEQFDLIVTREDRKSVLVNGTVMNLPDFVLTRISGDVNYFTMAVIRHLEKMGVPTYNSAASMDAVKDKLHSQQILAQSGLPVPATMLGKFPVDVGLVEKQIGFPVVVKTLVGTHGNGVFLCENDRNFDDLMQLIGQAGGGRETQLLFQQFISASHGRDLRVFVINGRAVAAMERRASDDSFKANFSRGGHVAAFKLTPALEQLAIETARVLDLNIAGIDILFDKNGYKICEANSAPDFRGLESCCDVSIADEILDSMIKLVRETQDRKTGKITDISLLRRRAFLSRK